MPASSVSRIQVLLALLDPYIKGNTILQNFKNYSSNDSVSHPRKVFNNTSVRHLNLATKTMIAHIVAVTYILTVVLILDIFQMPQKIQLTTCVGVSVTCYYAWSGQYKSVPSS